MIALSHEEIYFWLFQDHEYGYLEMHMKTKRKLAQTIVLIVDVKV